jgi:hypothetical protein
MVSDALFLLCGVDFRRVHFLCIYSPLVCIANQVLQACCCLRSKYVQSYFRLCTKLISSETKNNIVTNGVAEKL